ncbi:hypothetical protein Leryth_005308 [Lithospermum erythrorhizon]|nr:hypothetical protein Leryth_005308 [Lithospermum erythrorhizon]
MIQGSLGKNFDVVVAIKSKNGTNNFPTDHHQKQNFPTDHHQKQTARLEEINQTDYKNKIETTVTPKIEPKVEKLPSKKVQGVVALGPFGGTGGTLFDDGVYDGIRQINISRNVGIVYIRVCYELNGQPVWGSKNGMTGGFKYDKIVFDYPSEVLTHITGYHGPTMGMGPTIIKSLTFHTTKGKHGPYGEEKGQSFTTNTKSGIVVGFHGREGLFLDALGVHLLEGKALPVISSPSKHVNQSPVAATHHEDTNLQWSYKLGKKGLTEEAPQRVRVDPTPWGPGPWGGDGGKPWDDGVFTGIKQIVVTGADLGICCIEIEYDRNGQSVWSVKHGGSGGKTSHKFKLDYPNEVLSCVSGYYGPISKDHTSKVIKSLTFHTTRQKFGPFGEELGTYFTSNTTEGKVVGFHGKSGIYLDAIGVHMQHWLGHQRARPSSSLMKMFY